MAVKPVVYDDSTSKHRPLGSGEKMDGLSASSIISSDSGNLIQTGSDGLAYVSGSGIADPAADNLIEASANGRLKLTAARIAEWLDGHPQDAAAVMEALNAVSSDAGNILTEGSDGGALLTGQALVDAIASLPADAREALAGAIADYLSSAGSDVGGASVTAEGSTEPRSLSERFGDSPSAEDFGAKGDGQTNDDAAFEALEAAVSGVRIDLHGKTFKVTTPPCGNYYYNGFWKCVYDFSGEEVNKVMPAWDDNVRMEFGSVHSGGSGTDGRNYCVLNDSGSCDVWKTNLKNVVAIGENTMTNAIEAHNPHLTDFVAIGRGVMSEGDMIDNLGHNIGIGQHALHELTTGHRNIAIGSLAMLFAHGTSKTIAIGRDAAQTMQSGTQNVVVGYQALSGLGWTGGSTYLEAHNSVSPNHCCFIGSHNAPLVSGSPKRVTSVGAFSLTRAKSASNSTVIGSHNAELVGYNKSVNQYNFINYSVEYYDVDSGANYTCSGHTIYVDLDDTSQLASLSVGMTAVMDVPGFDQTEFEVTSVASSRFNVYVDDTSRSGASGRAYVTSFNEQPKAATFTASGSKAVLTPADSSVAQAAAVGRYVHVRIPGIGSALLTVDSKTSTTITVQLTGSAIDGTSGDASIYGVETDTYVGYSDRSVNRAVLVGELQFSKATSVFAVTAIGSQVSGKAAARGDFSRTEMLGYLSGQALCSSSDSVLLGSFCAPYADDSFDGVVIGHYAGNHSDYIRNSVVIGDTAGFASGATYNSVIIGDSAGHCLNGPTDRTDLNSKCRRVVAIGYGAMSAMQDGSESVDTLYDSVALGAFAKVSGSNQVQLGDTGSTTYVYGSVQDRSDARDKADVRDTALGLAFIKALRPVDFRWDYRDSYIDAETLEDGTVSVVRREKDGSRKRTRFHHGLIAQEVKAVMDAQGIDFGGYQDHKVNGGCDVLTLGYEEFVAPLVKAVQELDARLSALEAR